jgi:CDP-diacylglycerol--serine O-phosphatidyltransferase
VTNGPLAALHPANALTFASLAAAAAGIAAAANGSRSLAGALIALAVIADTFDGRYARRFRRSDAQRALGAQLDSLSDAIAFGAAPCVIVTLLAAAAGASLAPLWWVAVFVYLAGTIARLGFYNITHASAAGFIGLPVPVAALVWSTAMLFDPGMASTTVVLLTSAAAMVLPVPIPRPTGAGLATFAAWPVVVIVTHLAGLLAPSS